MDSNWNHFQYGAQHSVNPYREWQQTGAQQYGRESYDSQGMHFQNSQVPRTQNSVNKHNIPGFDDNVVMRSMNHETDDNPYGLFENYGISQQKPKHPQYEVFTVRESSYREFPPDISQTAAELAKAGFFYSGKDDVVFCFFCGQGLKSWEPDDDPFIEHARWAPACHYLLSLKGKDFVEMIQIAHNNPEQQEYPQQQVPMDVPREMNTHVGKNEKDNSGALNIQKSSTRSLMDTIAAQSLLANGYEENKVKQAIDTYISLNGDASVFHASDLLNILFAIEDGTVMQIPSKEPSIVVDDTDSNKQHNNITAASGDQPDVQALRNENQQLKDQTLCKICLEETVSIVFLPCGHLCACAECAPALRKCPICRTFIKGTVKTFLA